MTGAAAGTGQQIRLDRIFYQAVTTGETSESLADLFGLSIDSTVRYASIVDRSNRQPSSPERR